MAEWLRYRFMYLPTRVQTRVKHDFFFRFIYLSILQNVIIIYFLFNFEHIVEWYLFK